MTDISLFTRSFLSEDRSWDLTPPEGAYEIGGTLNISLFTAAQHFPNGYIPSGTLLGAVTVGGLWGPYLDAASDGRTTAVGILRFSVKTVRVDGSVAAKVGAAALVHGKVSIAKLPLLVANAPGGGYYDANAAANLPLIYFGA